LFGRGKVETPVLAEERDEFKAPLGVDYFMEGGIDGVPQGASPEDSRRLTGDILVNVDGCLRHEAKIPHVVRQGAGVPYVPANGVVTARSPENAHPIGQVMATLPHL
jgi:hypothetical protein